MKDIIVPLRRRAAPQLTSVEPSLLHDSHVLDDQRVVDCCSVTGGVEVVARVEVGDVAVSPVGLGAVVAVLVDVHSEEEDVGAVDLLEEEDALCSDGELFGAAELVVLSSGK